MQLNFGLGVAFVALLVFATQPLLAETKEAKSPDRIVYKHRQKTGTRFTTKTCKPASEWERLAEEARKAAGEMIDRPAVETRRGG